MEIGRVVDLDLLRYSDWGNMPRRVSSNNVHGQDVSINAYVRTASGLVLR